MATEKARLERIRSLLERAHAFTSFAQGLTQDEVPRSQSIAFLDLGASLLLQAICELDAVLASCTPRLPSSDDLTRRDAK